jgi:hypothetical protein
MILKNMYVSGEAIADWLDRPAPWVIEGVTATLALRAWLKAHTQIDFNGYPANDERPCDCVLMLWFPIITLTDEQHSMLNELKKRWGSVQHELVRRGVEVQTVVLRSRQ